MERLRNLRSVSKIIDYFEKIDSYVIIMEKTGNCVDLFDFISEKGHLDEENARKIFSQILETIQAIHNEGDTKKIMICYDDDDDLRFRRDSQGPER